MRRAALLLCGLLWGTSLMAEDLLTELRVEVQAEVGKAARVELKTRTVSGTGDAKHREAQQTLVSLTTGEATYQLQYDLAVDEQGRRLPMGHPLSELGMPQPTPANWYQNGFIEVLVDGTGLAREAATIRPLELPPGQAGVRVAWPQVTLDLRVHAFDPVLYAVLQVPAGKPVRVELLCYPNSFQIPRDRWLTTARRDLRHRDNLRETLGLGERDWVLYSDRAADMVFAPRNGPSALVMLPEQWSEAELVMGEPERPDWPAVQNYGVFTRLTPQAGQTRLALGLIEFLPMNWPQAKHKLQEQLPAIQQRLRGLQGE